MRMNRFNQGKTLLTAVLVCVCAASFAQKDTKGVWKKQVSREIDMQIKEDDKKHHLKDLSNDTTLVEMILNAIKAGKITAYSNWDHSFTKKVTYKEIYAAQVPKPDTVIIVDPVTGQELQKIVAHDFDPDVVRKYRILENWTFNPTTGNTDIHIEGVAPLREIVVDGNFRGMQALFWVHYNELLPILTHYEQLHPENSIATGIWNDYFYTDVNPK